MGRETSVLSICLMEDTRASEMQPCQRVLYGGTDGGPTQWAD